MIKLIRRQIFDIPVPKIQVTEHQAEVKYCGCCNKMVTALLYERILQEGFDYHKANLLPAIKKSRGRIANRPGHNLLIRLSNWRDLIVYL